jgi:hypothetical protein
VIAGGRARHPFPFDLHEKLALERFGSLSMFGILDGKRPGFKDQPTQVGGAPAVLVIEGYQPELPLRQSRFEQRYDLGFREPVFGADMHDRADKAAAAGGILVVTPNPAVIVGEKIKQEIEQLYGLAGLRSGHQASPDGEGDAVKLTIGGGPLHRRIAGSRPFKG